MLYNRTFKLKNGKSAVLRNADKNDAATVLDCFNRTHKETDYLLSYSDENSFTVENEGEFLQQKTECENEVELVAIVDGNVAGCAGIEAVGRVCKVRHRAEFGINVLKEYWGQGIGKALTLAAVECAKSAGYKQLELNVVADNERALALYKSVGFAEYGINPHGFLTRDGIYQPLVYMYLAL